MFHNSLWFVVISENQRIEEALHGVFPLEDCDYRFQTVPQVEDAALDMHNPDVAWIFDCVERASVFANDSLQEERIVVVEEGNPLLTDPGTVAFASDCWVMPMKEGYKKDLLTIYFRRLAKRMKERADNRKEDICFRTVMDAVPDISWCKDTVGAHLLVNNSFCETVGKTREEIYKKGHCYIWDADKEDEEICLASDRIIMENKTPHCFEEPVKTRTSMRMFKTYKSALIDVTGEVFGTCGTGHDITELRNMSSEMDLILKSIPFAILVESKDGVVLNKNVCFDKYFPDFEDIVGKPSKIWRQSLNKKLLLEDQLMDVVVQEGEDQRVLVFEEEPIMDIFGDEIGKVVTLMDITLQWSVSQQNKRTANTDYLTGLHNRRNLMNYLGGIYSKEDVTIVLMDLDNFKQVNDVYGHKVGDKALIRTAEVLQESFKDQFVCRMGGDEFLVVMEGKTMGEVEQAVENMLKSMYNAYQEQEEFQNITVSAGILSTGMFAAEERVLSDILKVVDKLLYDAKAHGKNCYYVYGEENSHSV